MHSVFLVRGAVSIGKPRVKWAGRGTVKRGIRTGAQIAEGMFFVRLLPMKQG
jgi:hypothetical protein